MSVVTRSEGGGRRPSSTFALRMAESPNHFSPDFLPPASASERRQHTRGRIVERSFRFSGGKFKGSSVFVARDDLTQRLLLIEGQGAKPLPLIDHAILGSFSLDG